MHITFYSTTACQAGVYFPSKKPELKKDQNIGLHQNPNI